MINQKHSMVVQLQIHIVLMKYMLLEGFRIKSIEQDHIFPYQIEPYKAGKFIKQPWFEAMPEEIFSVLKKKLGWHLLIEASLIE